MQTARPSAASFVVTTLLMSAWLAFPGASPSVADDGASSLREALTDGKAKVAFRYRFETVADDAPAVRDRDAEASTLRTTVSYRTGAYRGFSLFLEAEDVSAIGDDRYDNRGAGSLFNGVTDRPVVADPELTEINQAYLGYTRGGTTLRVGRQEILVGNQRFVGSVGWRQHHQSFEAASLVMRSLGKLDLQYHYLASANRIFGDRLDMSSHLLHGDIDLGDAKLSLYGYLLDYDDVVALSSQTFGARIAGTLPGDGARLSYVGEYARQQDAGDNPQSIDAGYYHAELAYGRPALVIKVGGEVLEGEPGDGAFQTPLATLHKFNGFADKFLRTPGTGLEDLYASIGGKTGRFSWATTYHVFEASSGDAEYGTELDLLATYKAKSAVLVGFKAAFYEAEDFSFDTEKLMLWLAYSFGNG